MEATWWLVWDSFLFAAFYGIYWALSKVFYCLYLGSFYEYVECIIRLDGRMIYFHDIFELNGWYISPSYFYVVSLNDMWFILKFVSRESFVIYLRFILIKARSILIKTFKLWKASFHTKFKIGKKLVNSRKLQKIREICITRKLKFPWYIFTKARLVLIKA